MGTRKKKHPADRADYKRAQLVIDHLIDADRNGQGCTRDWLIANVDGIADAGHFHRVKKIAWRIMAEVGLSYSIHGTRVPGIQEGQVYYLVEELRDPIAFHHEMVRLRDELTRAQSRLHRLAGLNDNGMNRAYRRFKHSAEGLRDECEDAIVEMAGAVATSTTPPAPREVQTTHGLVAVPV